MRLPVLCAALALAACGGVPASNAPAARGVEASVAPGAALPFGEVARACGVAGAALGVEVESASGFTLHDTAPGSTAPRAHFVTGFADGCPRQVTAAFAVFGDVGTHETLAASAPGHVAGAADRAFEALKAQVCGTAPGQPCGASLPRLAADTVFVSVYPALGSEESREILLHGGAVVAAD